MLTLTPPAGAGAKKPPALWQKHKATKDAAAQASRIVQGRQLQIAAVVSCVVERSEPELSEEFCKMEFVT